MTKEPTLTLKRIIWERNHARSEALAEVEKMMEEFGIYSILRGINRYQLSYDLKSKLKQLEGKSLVEEKK